ncbi:TPA: hypothetical protein N0F65_012132 [Lagenidium giganteum]|uniref:EF-hand domain-containing protein n=1 Tax=Lagenidium giganteum TaxID=4803 RepID=A0AAV2YLX1_9STRA|nr:TPA: hypothetical protein N0F65_012132 [Lagenidium giganteum]
MFELLDKDQDALFDMIDADSDNEVTQDESKRVLDTIVTTQRNVLAEIFGTHVDNMPKKHMKLLERSVYEENWKSKIPEKIIEFPEAHNLLAVYSKGFYDERYTFHERKRETRSTRVKGLALATAIGVGDYVAMIV